VDSLKQKKIFIIEEKSLRGFCELIKW